MKTIFAFIIAAAVAVPALAQDQSWVGVTVADQSDRGVLVRNVEANSPAEKAGIKANDVILQYNKQDVVGMRQFSRLVDETPVGRSVDVTVRRDNRDQTVKLTTEKAEFSTSPFQIRGPNGVHVEVPDFATVFRNQNQDHDFQVFRNNNNAVEVLTAVSSSQAGVRADSLTPQLRDYFGVKPGEGVLVASVDADSQAAKAGLKAGDVVTAVDGKSVSTPQAFNREIRSSTSYTLKVVRNKQEQSIRVEK